MTTGTFRIILVLTFIFKSFALNQSFNEVFVPCDNSSTTFKCLNSDTCIQKSFVCDGVKHCSDNSDEESCQDKDACDERSQFTCQEKFECIYLSWKCDGQIDCDDGTDEKNCPQVQYSSECPDEEFKCNGGLCIPRGWQCDGHEDCLDGSDERNCSQIHQIPCHEFTCKGVDGDISCIPRRWVCDGTVDCGDGSDEDGCMPHIEKPDCLLSEESFFCKDQSGCIGFNLLCDGKNDCRDGSDESPACNITCGSNRCNQGCILLPGHKKETCFCQAGYHLAEDRETCYDINECEVPGRCSHICTNTAGSFECSCQEGYVLDAGDQRSCHADQSYPAAVLFFAVKSGEINSYNLLTHEFSTVYKGHKLARHPVGLSYDGVDHRLFWTNIETGNQSIVSSKLKGYDDKVIVHNGLNMPEDVVIDYVGRNIYFSDSGNKVIGVCTIDGRLCNQLITENVDQPRGLALYPAEGLLFYSDWGARPHISKAGMDGTRNFRIIRHSIKWPNGVTIDVTQKRIYWLDAYYDKIESADFDGFDRRVVLERVVRHPFSLAVFEDTLFWSDWNGRSLQSCNKFNGSNHQTILTNNNGTPMGIHIFHPLLEPIVPSPCYGEKCSHICLLGYGGHTSVCKCPEGMKLGDDGKTCNSDLVKYIGEIESDKNFFTTTKGISSRTFVKNGTKEMTSSKLSTPSTVVTIRATVLPVNHTKDMKVPIKGPPNEVHAVKDVNEVTDSSVLVDAHPTTQRASKTVGIVVAVCAAILLFIVVLVFICVCIKRRRKFKGDPLRFPNPTFGLPAMKSSSRGAEGSELKGIQVVGCCTKRQSQEEDPSMTGSNRSSVTTTTEDGLRYTNQLGPDRGRLEFETFRWSQPKLIGASSPTAVHGNSLSESMRRSFTNPELSRTLTESESSEESDVDVCDNDKRRLIN